MITVIGQAFNNNITVTSTSNQARISVIDNTTRVQINTQGGGATGAPGVGADPQYIAETEQRLTDLENKDIQLEQDTDLIDGGYIF